MSAVPGDGYREFNRRLRLGSETMDGLGREIQFVAELPFPEINSLLYRELYEYEQLFRRLAHAALVAKAGANWGGLLPAGLLSELKKRLSNLPNRIHLSCENSRNPVWITTMEELRTILTMDSIWSIVREFSGYQKTFLEGKLSDVIEIRNVIGHNRATSTDTLVVWRGIATSLRPGLDAFKASLLYRSGDEVHLENKSASQCVVALYSDRCRDNDWSRFQPMLSESKYFYALTHLPVDTDGDRVRTAALLEAFEPAKHVFCFMINKSGNEFSVVWPKMHADPEHEQIMSTFWSCAPYVWTHTAYEDQSSAYVCDPQIWFYENQRPAKE
jgi:hypothetical protein